MFQSKTRRKTSNEVHLCEFCMKKGNCKWQPPVTEWSLILKTCQLYDKVEIDYPYRSSW